MSASTILHIFKEKIQDAAAMVHEMDAEERLKAVEFWNVVSEQLQLMVNHYTEDIGAFTFHMDREKMPDYIDATQLVALGLAPTFMTNFITDSTTNTITTSRICAESKSLEEENETMMPAVLAEDDGMKEMQTTVLLHATEREHICADEIRQELACVAAATAATAGLETVEEVDEEETEEMANLEQQMEEVEREMEGCNVEQQMEEEMEDQNVYLRIEDEAEPEMLDDISEGNTVHLMISAECNPAALAENTYHRKRTKKSDSSAETYENGEENGEEEEGNYECMNCHRTFFTPSQLNAHSWTHTKPYVCPICDSRFSSKGNLVVHSRRHSGERPYPCQVCVARFSTKGNLVRHCKAHKGEKPWKCDECDARFTEQKSLKVHRRRHTGERPYPCTLCPKAFTQPSILQTHMAMHMDERAYKCTQCARCFRQKSQLRLHEQRHAGLRKYQCSQCGFKFLTKGDMERHQRTHTGERPFVCKLCSKSFTRQQSLNEHMNRHYGLKPYQCKYCKKGYVEMSACYKHIKMHEREKTGPETGSKTPATTQVLAPPPVPPTVVAATSPDSDKIVLLVQNNTADKRTAATKPVDLTTVIIQRVPDTVDLEAEGNSCDVDQPEDGSTLDLTAMKLLASASTFQQDQF